MQRLLFKTITLICLSQGFSGNVTCNAQRLHKHEIQVSYGPLARTQVIEDALTTYIGAFVGDPPPRMDFSNFYAATYRYQVHRRLAISVTSGFTSGSTYKIDYSHTKSFYRHSNKTTAFETKFSYVDGRMISLYAITGLGLHITRVKNQVINEAKTYPLLTCQLTPFGIRIGRQFGGFAEIGYGYKGIVNFGISARF
ncbi:hypothetical protein [Dyadobacter arcticus]|uniref:Outer membrane protein beta-barrel domain-containing protein n=1 Tax=Dyadobacter arcticus TaxID=1078754 RepID=A0ABX0UR74_9BACT|nr:hypothetical protein [Dyadobacter arcticus]NIJ55462.1 hypothetical protein [Dyadobacter arcticus]